ncbi:MAG: alanine--tRNA ligase [Planctomycetes bacterium]|nr:alanine--tRNA ligase [Planctomycetota bacterium]
MPTANEIRQQFIDFFCKKHDHTFVPSSSVVPLDDPTLLFTNAGMNQFKPYFLGTEKPPYPRAANTQKCIRAGGKHNDLDDVGKDTYHHTFFEMLGNWSFGDYFKKEAIAWAWELLTDVWKLDKARLHVTVFEGDRDAKIPRDDEAAGYWRAVGVPDTHIHLGNKKDNFWEMGDTGPCGPCTEIHYDNTPDLSGARLVNKGTPDVIEIWNLVFIQFNRNADKSLTPLPAKHVDTGMGFERVTKVLQGKDSNYDTDVFTPIIKAIDGLVNAPYGGRLGDLKDIAFRVIADHIRMLTFAISDGGLPSNKGRGAVVKSVLRRAFRFGYQFFKKREPFLYKLVPTVVQNMGGAFPELKSSQERVAAIVRAEEKDFLETIERGMDLFDIAAVEAIAHEVQHNQSNILTKNVKRLEQSVVSPAGGNRFYTTLHCEMVGGEKYVLESPYQPETFKSIISRAFKTPPSISGKYVFDLHTTHGFPPDLTRQMADERGLSVDLDRYIQLMREHEEISRAGEKKHVVSAIQGDLPATDDSPKYKALTAKATIAAWVKENLVGTGSLQTGDQVGLVCDKTNFYAEQGGQVGDAGWIKTDTGSFEVEDTQRLGDSVIHWGKVFEGTIQTGQQATLEVSPARLDTMRNHTATHLMNWALREVLGEHVEQKGSLVDAENTRFDFTHDKPMTHEEIAEVERLVNDKILADQPVTPITMPLADAKQIAGVRAVFGEKYPDPVRVLVIGGSPGVRYSEPRGSEYLTPGLLKDASVEFCGGTHLDRTSQACLFKIVGQEGVAKGVRRITAVTGPKAVEYDRQLSSVVGELSERFHCRPEELPTRIESLQDEIKKLQQQLKKGAASDLAGTFDKLLTSATKVGEAGVIIGEIPAGPDDAIRTQVDRVKQKAGSCVVVVGWSDEGKVGLLAAVSDDLVKKGVKAGDLIKQIAPIVGGGGGGRPNMAQAGGKDPSKLADALAQARKLVEAQLTK